VCLVVAVLACWAPGSRAFPVPSQQESTAPRPQTPAPTAGSQETPVIERIEFQGNRRIRSETLRARIFSRPGDALNEDALRRDFHALWNTQYFEDIRLEV